MPLLGTSPRRISELVKLEADNLFSRETANIKAATTLAFGQPVKLTAGELEPCLLAADLPDAVGIVYLSNSDVTATAATDVQAVYIARLARINANHIDYPADADAAAKAAFVALMNTKHIVIK